jgi:fructan beta-fructosidase
MRRHRGKTASRTIALSLLVVVLGAALALAWLARPWAGTPVAGSLPLTEPYRPQYHFTPAEAWMNDPNGLVYHDGEYHLFYQYNPDDTVWGPMHWGHAVSTDLVNWQHLPIALYPDDIGAIFSGSAVVDWENAAGFGKEALVAVFTHAAGNRQMQSLAYCTARGRTWRKYEQNPVIEPPNNIKNFRDPKVFWYGENGSVGHWVMSVAAGNIILFYASPDLKNWEATGGFGLGYGATCGIWETPDLFELPVDGGPENRWVLAVGIGGCAPGGGSGVQYFVGAFDGKTFTSENPKETVLWADYGADFYAAQSWNDAPDGRRIWLAWMNNWAYAQDIPTSTWRGAFTIPRELSLVDTPQGIRLVQRPVAELQSLRGKHWEWQDVRINAGTDLLGEVAGDTLEILAEFQVDSAMTAGRVGFRVRVGDNAHTTIGYAIKGRMLFVDRTQSGQVDFNPNFPGIHIAQMDPSSQAIRLHIFVDRSSVEVFGNDGQVVMTEQIFPGANSLGVEVLADGGEAVLNSLEICELAAATFLSPKE